MDGTLFERWWRRVCSRRESNPFGNHDVELRVGEGKVGAVGYAEIEAGMEPGCEFHHRGRDVDADHAGIPARRRCRVPRTAGNIEDMVAGADAGGFYQFGGDAGRELAERS